MVDIATVKCVKLKIKLLISEFYQMTIHFKRKKVYTCNGFVCIKSLSTEFQIGPGWLNELGSWIT